MLLMSERWAPGPPAIDPTDLDHCDFRVTAMLSRFVIFVFSHSRRVRQRSC